MGNGIVAPRVPLTDPKTGLISREWYALLLSLVKLTDAGQNDLSLSDLQVGPTTPSVEDVAVLSNALSAFADPLALLQQAPPPQAPLGTFIGNITASLDFPSTAAGACSDLTVTVPGAANRDVVQLAVGQSSVPVGGTYFAWVSATDTVTVRFANNSTTTAYDPPSANFRIVVTRY